MRYWQIGVAVLVIAIAAGVFFCRKKTAPEPEIDGGVQHRVDEHAPKVIVSEEVTYFHCKFSTTDLPVDTSSVAGHIITLHAGEDGGLCELRGYTEKTVNFLPDKEFFRQLQQIISKYDLAQYNGQYYTVSGLPPNLGMDLKILYASGEYIRAFNNQSSFLPIEAMEELVTLFEHQNNGGL